MATHEQVARHWSKQSGKYTTGHRMFYEGRKIYSHGRHWVLGVIIDAPHQPITVALFDSASTSRSPTTARHYRTASDAWAGSQFTVPCIALDRYPEGHMMNLKAYVTNALDSMASAKRARIHKMEYMRRALRIIMDAHEYAQTFQLTVGKFSKEQAEVFEFPTRAVVMRFATEGYIDLTQALLAFGMVRD